jgi:predicted lipoprotein with Yx(FWY)xxD motif
VTRILSTALIVLALNLVGCGGDAPGPAAEEPAAEEPAVEEPAVEEPAVEEREEEQRETERPESEEPPGVEISTSDSQFGEVLFDGDGQAIYYFEVEQTSEPRCYGSCAEAWPPVLTDGEPQASGNVRQGLLGVTKRRDGSMQVTYDGRPLYYYVDEDRGELRCHNIFHEGGLWLAVQPNGEAVPHNPDETIFLD